MCSNYITDSLLCFKYIKPVPGELIKVQNIEGIKWIFLLSGNIVVKRENEELQVKKGEMCLFPNIEVEIECFRDSEFLLFTSDRPTEFCSRLVMELPKYTGKEYLQKLSIHSLLYKFLKSVEIGIGNGISCRYFFEEKQEELFMILNACYTKEELSVFLNSLNSHREVDLKKFIIENSLKAKSVQELAGLCGYSVSGFKRVFKEIFDDSVYRWMLKQKADYLKKLLTNKEVNLKVIIDELGFSSPAHFTKFCKQWLGMPPTQFIKSQQDQFEF